MADDNKKPTPATNETEDTRVKGNTPGAGESKERASDYDGDADNSNSASHPENSGGGDTKSK